MKLLSYVLGSNRPPLGSPPGLRRLVSYKLALHVLATFTEPSYKLALVPIQKYITLF